MADLQRMLDEVADGRLSRRRFIQRAAGAGLSPSLAAAPVAHPAAARSALPGIQGTPAPVGPALDSLIFSSFNVDQAPLQIQNGEMDLYLFGLKIDAARQLAESALEAIELIEAPASTLSLILNPAPAPEGELNPFAIREIRQAMQYLVDREFIANDIFQGRALPMFSPIGPLDYDQLTVFETIRTRNYHADVESVRRVVSEHMQAAGAQPGADGKWSFNGRPITLKLISRVEDERRAIGDLFRVALENVGFAVQPILQQFGPATLAVYASDPITFQWHVYTEGWGRSSSSRYDDAALNSFAAPWLGNMPGWQETGFWQYQQDDLDALGQRLFRGEFTSKEERDELFNRMLGIALDESVRIWLVTALQAFPVREEVENLTVDIVGGPKSIFSLRSASIEGGSQMRVGHLWIWTERTTWNPIGGYGDVYSADIYRNMVDPPIVNHPFTGLPMPFRADYEVENNGPEATVAVPEDAVMWDAGADAWSPVGSGITATSKVTFDYSKYFASRFHHGQPITIADIIYPLAQTFEFAYDEQKIQIETAIGITSRPYLDTFKGFRLLEDDRLEVYVNYWYFEPNYIASYASITSPGTPWELLAAMDDIVFTSRTGAYTDTAAARFNVPWLNLTTDQDARLVQRTLRQLLQEARVPEGVFDIGGRTLVSPEEATARYQADLDWFDQTNLLVISNGPFSLSRYDPPAQFAELTAFRPPDYPFSPEDFRFGSPPEMTLTAQAPASVPLAEPIEVPVTVNGPGALTLDYVLVDPATGGVIASGRAEGDGGQFTV
ncbi:MAG TPA: ABC transporter substrate-binding protein, partial [Thermomicrobiales bacterium]|nr:ABC transporter substrate-binding protein [Thermomicrobiales bacterium]